MAIGPILLELWPAITQALGQKVVQAFVATQGPVPEGMTNAQFTERCIKRFIRSVVDGQDRLTKEAELSAIRSQNAIDFPEA